MTSAENSISYKSVRVLSISSGVKTAGKNFWDLTGDGP